MRILIGTILLLLSCTTQAAIDITVENNPIDWPVTCGVALPDGYANNANEFSLTDDQGRVVPFAIEEVSRWRTEGPLKWVHLRWIAKGDTKRYRLNKQSPQRFEKLPVREQNGVYTVQAGGLSVALSKTSLSVTRDGQSLVKAMSNFIAKSGQPIDAIFETLAIERHTPTEVTFLLTGKYDESAHLLLRITLHRGVPIVFFDHTFRFMGDLNKDEYSDIAIRFDIPEQSQRDVTFDLGADGVRKFELQSSHQSISMVQENVIHLNNATPLKPEHEGPDYYRVITQGDKGLKIRHEGERCGDYVAFEVAGVPMAASLRHFWQTFPKEWQVSSKALTLHLWSPHGGKLGFSPEWRKHWIGEESLAYNRKRYRKYDLLRPGDPRGADRRHLFQLAFGDTAAKAAPLASKPAVAHVDPTWLCDAKPFIQPIIPANPNHPNAHMRMMEQTIESMFDLMLDAVDKTGGYGFLEHGHGHHYFYEWNPKADRLFIGFYRFMNHDYFVRRNLWMNYYRSSNRKYLDYLIDRMHHFLDVEVAHADARNNIPDGSWCKDTWYWENWQNAFERTYQVSARGIIYYLAYSGDPRARWQLNEWRQWFLKKDNIDQWAQEHLMWGGASFSAWRVPSTTIGNLISLYEMFGDQKLLDMAVAIMRAFEDKNSPSGTKYIWSMDKYEYTMWFKGEYYRVPRFNEVVRVTGNAELTAMRDKLLNYWMLQRANFYSSYDQVPITLYHQNRDPVASSMLKMFIEDPARKKYLERIRKPIGPNGPQGVLHPSNDIRLVWFTYPGLIAVYDRMLAEGTDGLLNRFQNAGSQKVWIGQKRESKPFVMQLIAPGREASLQFFDQAGKPIEEAHVKKVVFSQKADAGNHVIYTVNLPADHSAQQVWATGDGSFLIAGSETTYLFDPGDVWTGFNTSKARIWFRSDSSTVTLPISEVGGRAPLTFYASNGRSIVGTKRGSLHRFQTRDGLIGIEPNRIHWRSQAAIDLRDVKPHQRFMAVGDSKGMFEPASSMVDRFAIAHRKLDLPNPSQAFVTGVSGQAMLINEKRSLVIKGPEGQGAMEGKEGTIEFWFKPLWDVRLAGGLFMADNLQQVSLRKSDEIFSSLKTTRTRGTYFVTYPNAAGKPMEPNRWYHVAIGWKTIDKPHKPFAAGTGMVWITIDGRKTSVKSMAAGNEKRRSDKPLIFSAKQDRPYLIDEIRISKTNRYLKNRNDPGSGFGGFELDAVRPPTRDDDTLLLMHLDGNVSGEGPMLQTHDVSQVKGTVALWP